MYWIWLIIVVSLTLALLVTVPNSVLRTAIGNCTRADGSKSLRRKQIETRYAWSFVGGMVVIPVILMVIHVNVTLLVEHFYVDQVPQEWVAEIERADTIENDVNEVLAEFSEWNEKQQFHSHTNKVSWQDAIWSNWMYFAADAAFMGIAIYFFLGRYYFLLVSTYTKGVESRHRVYTRIDQKRSSEELDDPLESQNGDTGSDDETLAWNSDLDEVQEPISPYGDLNEYIKELSREGFLDAVFKGLVLPAKRATIALSAKQEHALVDQTEKSDNGSPIGWRESTLDRLSKVENELKALRTSDPKDESIKSSNILGLEKQITELNQKISDLTSREIGESPIPGNEEISGTATNIALFCLMDTSSSMDKIKLDIAKRFFILLYFFLQKNLEHIEVIYIQHQATAKEIDEDGFFKAHQQTGTVISSSLELMHKIILERFTGSEWNIYAAQVSDGANKESDYSRCLDILGNKILNLMQYYIYVETITSDEHSLWHEYETLKADHNNLAMQRLDGVDTLYSKFRSLFDKRLQ